MTQNTAPLNQQELACLRKIVAFFTVNRTFTITADWLDLTFTREIWAPLLDDGYLRRAWTFGGGEHNFDLTYDAILAAMGWDQN